jgi:hypothetical protein
MAAIKKKTNETQRILTSSTVASQMTSHRFGFETISFRHWPRGFQTLGIVEAAGLRELGRCSFWDAVSRLRTMPTVKGDDSAHVFLGTLGAFVHGMERIRQDFRFAFRTLRRTPGFAPVTVITISLWQ